MERSRATSVVVILLVALTVTAPVGAGVTVSGGTSGSTPAGAVDTTATDGPYTLSGRVFDASGQAVGDGTVEVLSANGTTVTATTAIGTDGRYALENLTADDYRVRATVDNATGGANVTVDGNRTQDLVVLSANATTTPVQVVLDGAPDGLFRYNLTVDGPGTITAVTPSLIDGQEFAVDSGGVGTSSVGVRAADTANQVGPFTGTRTLATVQYAGVVDVANVSVAVTELSNDAGGAMNTSRVGLQLATQNATVSGQVLNGSGTPVPAGNATVELRQYRNASVGYATVSNTTVGTNGTYAFANVRAGLDYELAVTATDGSTGATRVDDLPAGNVTVDVTVPEYGNETGDTGTETAVQVVLDGAPDGLFKYNLTVGGPSSITALEPGLIDGQEFEVQSGGVGNSSVGVRAADVSEAVGPFSGTRTLVTIRFEGVVDLRNVSVSVADIENDSRGAIDVSRVGLRLADGNATIAGRVANGTDVAIPAGNATVELRRYRNATDTYEPIANTTVGTNGTYAFANVRAGFDYELVATATDGSTGATRVDDLPSGNVTVDIVVPGYGNGGNLTADNSTAVQVVLNGAPNGLRRYNLSVTGPTDITDIEPGLIGGQEFQLRDGGVGNQSVTVRAADVGQRVGPFTGSRTLVTVRFEGVVDLENVSLTVFDLTADTGAAMNASRVGLRPGSGNATVTGRVVNGTGVAIPAGNATVELRRFRTATDTYEPVANTTVGTNGSYAFTDVRAGFDYELVVTATDNSTGSARIDDLPAGNVTLDVVVPGYGSDDQGPSVGANQTLVEVVLTEIPNGLFLFNITVASDGATVNRTAPVFDPITDIQNVSGGQGESFVTVRTAILFGGNVTRTTTTPLYTVTFDGNVSLANLTMTVHSLQNASQEPMNTSLAALRIPADLPLGERLFENGIPASSASRAPIDIDGDGRLEDMNGDGRFNFVDVVEFVFSVQRGDYSDLSPAQIDALDHTEDGRVSFVDVIDLVFELQNG
jgi:hypothetical protein